MYALLTGLNVDERLGSRVNGVARLNNPVVVGWAGIHWV